LRIDEQAPRERPDITRLSPQIGRNTKFLHCSFNIKTLSKQTLAANTAPHSVPSQTNVRNHADSFHPAQLRAVWQAGSPLPQPRAALSACSRLCRAPLQVRSKAELLTPLLHPTPGITAPASPCYCSCCAAASREDERPEGDLTDELQQQLTSSKGPTETKLSPEQLQEVCAVRQHSALSGSTCHHCIPGSSACVQALAS
jgi:hypothetical protein